MPPPPLDLLKLSSEVQSSCSEHFGDTFRIPHVPTKYVRFYAQPGNGGAYHDQTGAKRHRWRWLSPTPLENPGSSTHCPKSYLKNVQSEISIPIT